MKIPIKDRYRLQDKIDLILKVNYSSSLFAFILGIICLFLLDIKGVIPYACFGFAVVNLVNTLLYKQHQNLILTYNLTSVLAMIGATLVTIYSGGIQSPFVFVLAIVVFAGYVTTKVFGQLYLIINLSVLAILFLYDVGNFKVTENTIPLESRDWFAFLSAVFAVYLLGGVFGKNLLRAHHKLYKSRNEIQERIQEKEILLKEVHHRVKNNLQTVSSLLSLQSRAIADEKISNIIKSSQNRVVSMAMVHEMLYKRDDYLSKIELKPYVQELCDYLVRSVKGNSNSVKVNLDIDDNKLSIDTIIPLGLIINETITNALKYGITEEHDGEIHISLHKLPNDRYEMFLGDNGIGYSEDINPRTTNSLGLKLIYNLTRQLRGTISRDYAKKGTYYRIEFEEIIEEFNSVD
ncbi:MULTISPECIES: sensor histidine kinase [Flavobacteriaceae]|jgi:two-component sensor histidine kinase|uniref:histidine kinase n=1 Tax=Flagellimonas alvinocaridis TaxID=2530200 RepID=A0A4S8RQ54_9FLAO|nr:MULTISPECIES: sensor histidine kinase [Allomuricauda]MDC6362770.1 sensor histidine kinase [Muricauda sp. SP22]THV60290.1 sensor histidine kinase [Allomuricauda alvinocaridis]